jgi:hypothetical protein
MIPAIMGEETKNSPSLHHKQGIGGRVQTTQTTINLRQKRAASRKHKDRFDQELLIGKRVGKTAHL